MEESKAKIRITISIMMIASFITPFMGSAVNLAIPTIGKEFSGNQYWLNWVVLSYLLTSAVFLLPFGRLADLLGRKKVFLTGMLFFALTSLACALAPTLPVLVGFRFLQGLASSMIFGTSMAILVSVIPPQVRGKAIGFNTAAVYTGLSAGPVVGGFLCSLFSWRVIFYFIFFLAIIVICFSVRKLPGENPEVTERFDISGSVLYILGLGLFLYGLADLTASFLYWCSSVAGLVILILFIVCEGRVSYPLLPVSMFRKNRVFTFSNLAALINYSATAALTYLLSLYLQTVLSLDTSAAGLVLLAQPIVMALLSPLSGILSDRIEPRLVASLGMALSALGLFFFIFLGNKQRLFSSFSIWLLSA